MNNTMKTQLNIEIEHIQHEGLKTLVKKTLEACPECFWTMPASTTGKHHPTISLGEGGLIRHTKAVFKIANILLEMLDASAHIRSICLAGALLHDCCKKNDDEEYTAVDHPLRAANLVREIAKGLENVSDEDVSVLAGIIAAHMGRWNTSDREPDVVLPTPKTPMQRLVHTADYLASRKDITISGI